MIALLLAGALAMAPPPRMGATVVVERPTAGPVVALLGDVEVDSTVVGDVVAVGGDVHLAPGATVTGDVVALGGRTWGPGVVHGRAVATGGMSWLAGSGAPAWGFALLRAGVWAVAGALLLLAVPGWVREVERQLPAQRWRAPVIGVLSLAVWFATVALAMALLGSPVAAAVVAFAVAVLLAAKVVGLAAVASYLGGLATPRLPRALRGEVPRTGVVLVGLCLFALVPAAGPLLWLAADVIGIGAVISAVLARRPLAALRLALAAR